MDEKDYRYVLTIAKYKSFTRAAEILYTSQPALSRHIKILEDRIGHLLFNRDSPALELTKVGERFCHYANIVLEQERAFFSEAQRLSVPTGIVIKIGVPPLSGDYIISRILPTIMKKYPQIHCDLTLSFSTELYQRLISHQIDLYIGTFSGNDPSISSEYLFSEPVYMAGSRKYPALANYDMSHIDIDHPIMLTDVAKQMKDVPLILCNPPMPIHQLVEDKLKEFDFLPVRKIKVTTLPLALDLTAQGVGFTAILRCQLKYGNPKTVREVYPISLGMCEMPLYIVYNSFSRKAIPELDHFIQEVREIYAANPEI